MPLNAHRLKDSKHVCKITENEDKLSVLLTKKNYIYTHTHALPTHSHKCRNIFYCTEFYLNFYYSKNIKTIFLDK